MSKHRSLSNALLTPEKLAFIKGEAPSSVDEPSDSTPSPLDDEVEESANLAPVETKPAPPRKPASLRGKAARLEPPPATTISENDAYLVAITTRLKSRTADALRRAHLEQKLNRREPDTQQEIIEAAVQHWLREHSYLD